jgi:hypothetical protein
MIFGYCDGIIYFTVLFSVIYCLHSLFLYFYGSLKAPIKFYVIDAETSYRALLGRPWLHNNHIIPFTLHQCLKYIENDKQKRIDGDVKPFGVHEIKFNDA